MNSPEVALDRLVDALNRGDLRRVGSGFVRDGCLVTPDATVIRGRGDIAATLAQLVGVGFSVQLDLRIVLAMADLALLSDRWTTVVRDQDSGELRRQHRGTALLRVVEGGWRIVVLAPWGWAADQPACASAAAAPDTRRPRRDPSRVGGGGC